VVSNPIEMVSTRDQRCVTLRRAVQADRERVAVLLRELELPTDGVAEWLDQFWIGEHEGAVVGVAGMERYGAAGLLRSVAVAPEWRGSGIGRALVDRVLEESRRRPGGLPAHDHGGALFPEAGVCLRRPRAGSGLGADLSGVHRGLPGLRGRHAQGRRRGVVNPFR
jgi:GNAT superfamily N-acetyltransferase